MEAGHPGAYPQDVSSGEVESPRGSDTEATPMGSPTTEQSNTAPATPNEAPAPPVVDEEQERRMLENQQAKAMLQRKDAIFEPDCFQHLRKYISTGGSPVEVINMLRDSYKGYPQMCNLVCDWLKTAGATDEEIEAIFYDYVKECVLEHFDVKKTDAMFQQFEHVPEWLEFMLVTPEWRQVLYELSNRHKESLLINYAIMRISEGGHQSEIASLPAATTYFPVYNRVLDYAFSRVLHMSEDDLFHFLPEFTRMCNHGEHTYLYAQALSYMLGAEPHGALFKRLSQEIERDVADKGSIAQRLAFYLTNILEYPALMMSISTMLGEHRANTSDMDKIYDLYASKNPPPVQYIRRPDFIDTIIRDMFNPAVHIPRDEVGKWVYVIAYASCARDSRPILAYSDANQSVIHDPPSIDAKLLEDISTHVTSVREICSRSYFGAELANAVDQLRRHINSPLASLGMLQWIRHNLVEGNNFTTAYNTKSFTQYFALLREISHIHPFQRAKVFEVLVQCFETDTELEAIAALAAKRTVVDNFAFLMEIGFVPPVLKYALTWAPVLRVDQSITRHFVTKVLENSDSPYSTQFIVPMITLMTTITADALKAPETAKVVKPFLLHCQYTGYPLPPDVMNMLHVLKSQVSSVVS